MPRLIALLPWLLLVACIAGDDTSNADSAPHAGPALGSAEGHAAEAPPEVGPLAAWHVPWQDGGHGLIERSSPTPFTRWGILADLEHPESPLLYQTRSATSGLWSPVARVPLTFQEGVRVVGVVRLDDAADALRLLPESGVQGGTIEAYAAEADPQAGTPEDIQHPPLREAESDWPGTRTRTQRLTPAIMPAGTITRHAWGARDPDKVCGTPHVARMATIHHTAGRNGDSDMPARMRQIQAFHIDSREWCDIGYHFLIGQDGILYQGRSSMLRLGAHSGGHNTNNIGFCFVGTYTTVMPSPAMLDRGARLLAWLHTEHGVPLQRRDVQGHRQQKATECPGELLYRHLEQLIEDARALVPDVDPGGVDQDVDEGPQDVGDDDADPVDDDASPPPSDIQRDDTHSDVGDDPPDAAPEDNADVAPDSAGDAAERSDSALPDPQPTDDAAGGDVSVPPRAQVPAPGDASPRPMRQELRSSASCAATHAPPPLGGVALTLLFLACVTRRRRATTPR